MFGRNQNKFEDTLVGQILVWMKKSRGNSYIQVGWSQALAT